MITVLVVLPSLGVGGTERHLLQVLPRLDPSLFRVVIYTTQARGEWADRLEAQGVEVIAPPVMRSRLLSRVLSAIKLCTLMLTTKPDITHFFLPEAYLLGGLCALITGTKKRVMSRRSLNRYQQKHPRLAKLERWLHTKMDAIVGNSTAVCEELKTEGVRDDQLELIVNGIDPKRMVVEQDKKTCRQQLGLSEHGLVMSVVANLHPYKGHADLIVALNAIQNDLPEGWQLLCVGADRGALPALQKQAANCGLEKNIVFLGSRSDIPAFLKASDISILPTHEEGFPNAILEAMCIGLPVIATNVGGNPEAVVEGETGFLVPPQDPAALAQAILRLAQDNTVRLAFGQAAAERCAAQFSLDRCVHAYQTFYQQCLGSICVE